MNGQAITLPAPTPIYGSLNVESTPIGATIYIDGKEVGKTPRYINEVLIGQHRLQLVKEGYDEYSEMVSVAKGERKQVKAAIDKKTEEIQLVEETTTSNGHSKKTFIVNGVSFTMTFVEGGSFKMGSQKDNPKGRNYDSEADNDETPVHIVNVSSFYLGETEVTQALWKVVMGSNPSIFKGDNLPVENVSWNDCQMFIRKLNQLTGKNFRLPMEAEWEFAAKGGCKSHDYKYAGSNNIVDVAWYADNSDKKTHPVKSKTPNELGLFDMSGNVWEWCQDWYGSYNFGSQTNPTGPSTGLNRVLRGGSLYLNAGICRVSTRYSKDPNHKSNRYGFRLCLPQ